ncbi:hypothetical protein FD723_39795 (plasmid) [Nostoc sp. C052]|uniref:hypothetical protein n=1 Tax=Nostoc sp. C052 TaxID=2576902 RepID=UPI0015C40774|nr:hypothetical protein [Nostoc sp. C052]QLE46356.1 hypothetical protein FD723_39795 [Nostoc sp. C052]
MNFLQLKKIICFIEDTLEEDGYEDTIVIHHLDEILYFMWMVDGNMLTIQIPCESKNNRNVASVITTFCRLEEVARTCKDYVGSIACWINKNPTLLELNIGDFSFSFDTITDAKAVWQIPKNWEFEELYDVLTDFDLTGWNSLLSAAAIASKNKTKNKLFPAMQGVNINCFSDIMEIAAVNSTVFLYKYVKVKQEVAQRFSFTISPNAIFLLDTILEEPGENTRIRIDEKFVCFTATSKETEFVASVTTPFIHGIYTYPKIPINNVSIDRITVGSTHLIDAINRKKQEYHLAHHKMCSFKSAVDVLCNQININVKNNLALIKFYTGEILYVLSLDKDTPDSSFWTDIGQLSEILTDINEDKVFFILPQQEHQGLVIETDTCQYTVMGLIKRDRQEANCAFNDPVYKKVLYSSPGMRASEPTLDIVLTEFPVQEHIFQEWEMKSRQYNADCPYSWGVARIHQETLSEESEDLCDNLDYLYKNYQRKKGEVNESLELVHSLLNELRNGLEAKTEDENTTSETFQEWQSLIQEGILLRGRIIEDYLSLEKTYRVEMNFR